MTKEKFKDLDVRYCANAFIKSELEKVKIELFNDPELLDRSIEELKEYFLDGWAFDLDFSSYEAQPVINDFSTEVRPFHFKYTGEAKTLNFNWTGVFPFEKFKLSSNGDYSINPVICLNVEIKDALDLNVVEKNELCLKQLKEFKSFISTYIETRNKMLSDALDDFFATEYFRMLRDEVVINNYQDSLEALFNS